MSAYGIDTSVLVRLLTGRPAEDFNYALARLTQLRAAQPTPIVVSSLVVAEAYAVLQHHYRLTKEGSRTVLRDAFVSGLLAPSPGSGADEALNAPSDPGLADRLIAIDYTRHGQITLTLDRKMAALPGCQRL